MAWMVMAGVEMLTRGCNRKTCFELNATDLPDEATAEAEAKRRNEIEKRAGHDNVTWFPSEQLDMAALMARMKR